MIDNDWDIPVRILDEAETDSFPFTGAPEEPSPEDNLELDNQLAHELIEGHPAFDAVEPDFEPVDDTPDDYA